jgi:hypothetical protein
MVLGEVVTVALAAGLELTSFVWAEAGSVVASPALTRATASPALRNFMIDLLNCIEFDINGRGCTNSECLRGPAFS